MVWKTRYSVRLPMHMIQPRKRSLWVWKLGSVKATAKACKRASSDGMIDHTEGGSWLLGECQRHGCNLKYTEVLPPFPSLEICESSAGAGDTYRVQHRVPRRRAAKSIHSCLARDL